MGEPFESDDPILPKRGRRLRETVAPAAFSFRELRAAVPAPSPRFPGAHARTGVPALIEASSHQPQA